MAPGAEGLLLYDRGQGLRDDSFARNHTDSSADPIPNTATHTAAHATAHAAAHAAAVRAATNSAASPSSPSWTC